ncbi:Ras of Complex, Roc, domain of DAPkinase [Plasmodiophora brassicae]|uniref:Uncharacterized protein n=1 Tax=Plasmodiophora brassicae TaxID=37360 RepID=A0A0G4J2T5_PLABS|nr:hypothetical protein PBRA_008769 [Plasmodiophora brassicae]
MAAHLKLCVAGPGRSGKTLISNLIGGHGGDAPGPYDETVGCRILETELNTDGKSADGRRVERNVRVSVEIWDLGDQRFEKCWMAVSRGLHGLVVVYDPNNRAHDADLQYWFRWGQEHAKLDPRQFLVVANAGRDGKLPASLPRPLDKVHTVRFVAEDPGHLRNEVNEFAGVLFGFHPDAEFLDD